MDRHQREALDRHITGNYGEDQFLEEQYEDRFSSDLDDLDAERRYYEEYEPECQVSNCQEPADDGVLCTKHDEQAQLAADVQP